MNAINIKRSSYSVPKHLYLSEKEALIPGNIPPTIQESSEKIARENSTKKKLVSAQTIDVAVMKRLQKTANFTIDDDEDEEIVDGAATSRERSKTEVPSKTIPEDGEENFDIIEESTAPPKIGSPPNSNAKSSSDNDNTNAVHLFISCDNNRLVVGGG